MTEFSPLDKLTLDAFVTALADLEEPLPEITRDRINNLGRNPNRIGELDELARNYPPLRDRYLRAREALQNRSSTRTKGRESAPPPIGTEEQDNIEKQNILMAPDPVAAAREKKQTNQGNFWQRLLSPFSQSDR